ncbi:MAG: Zn-ribbon domain-containing OB-fold protein [Spirochaetota bacterium]
MAKEKDDRFKVFGTVSFTATTKVNDFIKYLQEGKVMATKCKKCGQIYFPPRYDCFKDYTHDMEWTEVTGAGKLVSYSKLQYGPIGFEGDLPYSIALLDYGKFQVFGRLDKSLPDNEIKIGMDMKTVPNKLPNGQLNFVFQKA